jgi:hypothetical protein
LNQIRITLVKTDNKNMTNARRSDSGIQTETKNGKNCSQKHSNMTMKFNHKATKTLATSRWLIKIGSRLVKPMRKLYKAKDDRAKLVFSPVAPFGAQIPAVAAAVLSGYGSH